MPRLHDDDADSSCDLRMSDTMIQGFEDHCRDTLGSRSDILLMVSASESSLWSLESYEFGLVVPNRSARKHRYDIERYHLPTVCHWLRVSLERCEESEDVLRRRQRHHVIYPHCRYTRVRLLSVPPMPVPTRVHSPWVTHTHRNPPAADLQVAHHRLPGYPPTHHRP